MPQANDELFDAGNRHQTFLIRFGGSSAREATKILAAAEKDLIERIAQRVARLGPTAALGTKRLTAILESIRQQNRDLMNALHSGTSKELKALAKQEVDIASRRLNEAAGIDLENFRPSPETLRTLVEKRGVGGISLRRWFTKLGRDRMGRLEAAVNLGVVEGDTMPDMVRRFRQAGDVDKRSAETLVRTHVNHVANQSRQALYEANSDIVDMVRWTATLDGRTCFTAGHMVLMGDGTWKAIERIKAGEIVIGGVSGKPRRVENTSTSFKSTVAVHLANGYNVECTPEHPFLTESGWIEANDLTGKGVCTYIPKWQAIYRRGERCGAKTKRAHEFEAHGLGAASSGYSGDHKIWDRECCGKDSIPTQDAQESMGTGNIPDFFPQNTGTRWVQHDKRRGGCCGPAEGNSRGSGQEAIYAIQDRPRICSEDAGMCQEKWTERRGYKEKMVGHTSGGSIADIASVAGIQSKNIKGQSKQIAETEGRGGSQDARALGKSGIPSKSQCSQGEEASRSSHESRMARKEKGGSICDNAKEMAKQGIRCQPQTILRKTGSARKIERRGQNEKIHCTRNGGGSEDKNIRGSQTAMGRSKSTGEETFGYEKIHRIEKRGWAIVYDIEVGFDHSFVCEGLIVHNSAICQARDGKTFELNQGPRPPAHPNCRSIMTPVMKPWDELAKPGALKPGRGAADIDRLFQKNLKKQGFTSSEIGKIKRNTRASMNGQVPRTKTYQQWLTDQPAGFQDEVLGPTKAALFRKDGLKLDKFVDRTTGRPFTLDELRRKNEKAFMSAKIEPAD